MKKLLVIFALLIASCDTNNPLPCKPVAIQISDANPIQFWPVDCDTYNEKEVCGIHPKCWCHPWQCDDEIKIQFVDDSNIDYFINVIGSDDSILFSDVFNKDSEITSVIVSALSEGENYGLGDLTWSTGSNPTVTGLTTGLITKKFRIPLTNGESGETINFTFNLDFNNLGGSGGTFNVTPLFYLFNSSMDESVQIGGGDIGGVYVSAGNKIETHSLTPTFIPSYLVATFQYTGSGGFTMGVDINSVTTSNTIEYRTTYTYSLIPSEGSPDLCNQQVQLKIIKDVSPDEVILKSDCLDIRDSHSCTTLIEYSNNRNFAGLIYQNVSPEQTFNIRVPAIFFHEEFPEEDEAMVLTTGIVKTNGTLKAQRLFDTDYMPYYMHRKLMLIFKHQTINIESLAWIKEEKYEIQEGNRMWPVKKAKVLLTENYIQRAVL